MTATEIEQFRHHGWLRRTGLVPKATVAGLRQVVLDQTKTVMSARGVSRSLRALLVFQQIAKLSALVKVADLHRSFVSAALMTIVTQLAGRAPPRVQQAQLLVSPASQGAWTLDGLNWHVDLNPADPSRIPGIQAFMLLDDVAPQGGAPLALAGSHRLAAEPAGVRAVLREALGAGAASESALRPFGGSIIEMSGGAGDVFLMDMRVLHTPSVNATRKLRLMATCRFLFND